jgi:hypothetical protein
MPPPRWTVPRRHRSALEVHAIATRKPRRERIEGHWMLEEHSSTRPRGRLAHELEAQEAGTLGSRDRSRSRPHLRAARF